MPAPGAYREYCTERRFWAEFGTPQPPLDDWPRRKIAEYTCIQRAIDEVDLERRRTAASQDTAPPPAGPRSTVVSTRAATTEATYQQLRAQAQPLPLPSTPGPAPLA